MAEAARQLERQSADYHKPIRLAPKIGKTALWEAGFFTHELGVNDPLTHLEQYLENGEAAMPSIDIDLITDCAERMEKPRFINAVTFDRAGNDFISRENKFSMRSMTAITEDKFSGNVVDIRLYRRAKIESKEVGRLVNWFGSASPNDAFVVESLPLTDKENCTVVRIYQKVNHQELIEHIVTLHNGSVDIFNQLHAELGANVPSSETPLELLDNMYVYSPPEAQKFESFLTRYVDTFDGILTVRNPGKEFKHGLEKSEFPDSKDDLALAASQTRLRLIYTDTIRALGRSDGYVTPDILRINDELRLGMDLREGAIIPTTTARYLMDSSLQYIAATLNRASEADLEMLASTGSRAAVVESAGYYGGEARAEGTRYDGACPSDSGGAAAQEAANFAHGHRQNSNSEQCVYCPKCKKTVDADKDYFDRGWWHCTDCKSTAPRKGVKQRPLPEEFTEESPDAFDILSLDWKKTTHEYKIKRILKRQAEAESEFEKKRLAKLLRQEQEELFKIAA